MGTYKIIGPLHPIYDKSIIVHRDEFDEILTLLRHGEYIILNAPRQTGKTTLLFQVQEALRDEGMTAVYINLEGRDSEGFYQDLCKDIARQVDDVIESDETYSIKDIQNQIDFRKYLEWIAAYTPKVQRLVFLLDEVGGVPDEVHDPFFLGFRAARIN
ncbi:AAA-like domain-containing protein, partial [bacterium]|nr:AAA-like domain-containing protein [bacterium]